MLAHVLVSPFRSPCLCPDPASAALFFRFAHATSPAQRIKKEPSRRSRPPPGPPRSPKLPLRVFDPPLSPGWSAVAIENRLPSPGGTHKEEHPMTSQFKHENVVKLAGVLGTAPELRITSNGR